MRLKDGVGPLLSIQQQPQHINDNHIQNLNLQRSSTLNVNDTIKLKPNDQTATYNNHNSVVNNAQWSYSDIYNNTTNQLLNQQQHPINTTDSTESYTLTESLLQNYNNNLASNIQQHNATTENIVGVGALVHHNQRNNITQLRPPRRNVTSSSICSTESSPDDSFLEYEEPHQSCSSVDTSPQGDEEDRGFELSDTDSLSDDGNLSGNIENHINCHLSRRGIVNPNYPGFQHLAHTLDYSIKTHASDTDYTDDDLEVDTPHPPIKLNIDTNNINNNINNNNNNNEEAAGGEEDPSDCKIDSVNRLDSVENISKVFYDKPKFNIPLDEFEGSVIKECNQVSASLSIDDIIGDFGREIEEAIELLNIEINEKVTVDDNTDESSIESNEKVTNVDEVTTNDTKLELTEEAVTIPHDLKLLREKREPVTKMETIVPTIEAVAVIRPFHVENIKSKTADAFLSDTRDDIITTVDSNKMEMSPEKKVVRNESVEMEKFCKEVLTPHEKEKEDEVVPRKKEKIEVSTGVVQRRDYSGRNRSDIIANRRSAPVLSTSGRNSLDKKRSSPDNFGSFDVYNIETAMPHIDLDAIESHLRAAREEERRRRTDREEIRRRLAMGSEADDYYTPGDRPGRKPSLQARLQSGMNLQICFMNETVSDSDSPNSDNESTTITTPSATKPISRVPPYHKPATILTTNTRPRLQPKSSQTKGQRPLSLPLINEATQLQLQALSQPVTEADFFARQARLQIEARMALAQAKEMAHMQMEVERQKQKKSPITEMVRSSLEKVGIQFPEERRRVSRQILTEMNVAQLQVIVNDLHTQIEGLNEGLVRFLMDRDDLHMEQDSMLVDIEDLTRYLGAKEQTNKEQKQQAPRIQNSNNNIPPPSPLLSLSTNVIKPRLHRIASLVKK